MQHQLAVEVGGQHGLGQVILGGAQAAGDQHDFAAAEGLAQRIGHDW